MEVKLGQIWWKNYATDYHSLVVRVQIIFVDNEKIVSKILSSWTDTRPTGSEIIAYLDGIDPYAYKVKFGWHLEAN